MTTNRHPEYKLEDYTKNNPELAKEVEKEMKRMTNYERIKAMNIDELSNFLGSMECDDYCIFGYREECSEGLDCQIGIRQWLESEE